VKWVHQRVFVGVDGQYLEAVVGLALGVFQSRPRLRWALACQTSITKKDNEMSCCAVRYKPEWARMIKSFRHKGLQRFFETGSKAGTQAAHAARLRLQLAALDQALKPEDLSAPAWGLHPLKGDLKGHWAITVNGNW